ncbi:stabilin-1-like [Sapajus apella]|uniref:Stabilin-1-like n=1 Tax=Sapajus apella TaxID=9515 RepID=A0A6J3HJQ2_SAPAP|nr:stabilin-1-like [Sapajus apella]
MVAAFVTPTLLPVCVQSAGITLPADRQVTVLVPSEAAVRRLSPEDQAFWLQPRMLPNLVRAHFLQGAFFEKELARLHGQEAATPDPSNTLGDSQH